MRSKTRAAIAAMALVAGAACSGDDDPGQADIDTNSNEAGSGGAGDATGDAVATAPDGPFVRELAVPLEDGSRAAIEFEVTAVERTADSTALYLSLRFLERVTEDNGFTDDYSAPPILVDPVAGRLYPGLADDLRSDDPDFYFVVEDASIGPDSDSVQPGDHFDLRMYFPPLPDAVEAVTVAWYDMGNMTGIPVTAVDRHRPLTELGAEEGREPGAQVERVVLDMQGYVESPVAATERSGDTETIALQADVLFDFDDASLTGDAAGVLEDTAGTIRANAAADATTISVTGHTDGVGDAGYNDDLSRRRAEAVRDELGGLLGADYSFDVSGRGSSEPVATEGGPDDEEARARNRRVEISYSVEVGDRNAEASDGSTIDAAERHVADPAPFRPEGSPVATETIDGWQLDVHPLVRDGAYVVGEFEITNTGSAPASPELQVDRQPVPTRYRESSLGGFRLVEPDTELTRFPTIIENPDRPGDYADVAHRIGELHPGHSYRGVAIYPAPPLDTDELTLLAGPFGEITGVPIQ